MKQAVLNSTPADFGYDTNLWACPILAPYCGTSSGGCERPAGGAPEGDGLTSRNPNTRNVARDEGEIARFLDDKFQGYKVAKKMGRTSR